MTVVCDWPPGKTGIAGIAALRSSLPATIRAWLKRRGQGHARRQLTDCVHWLVRSAELRSVFSIAMALLCATGMRSELDYLCGSGGGSCRQTLRKYSALGSGSLNVVSGALPRCGDLE